MSIVQKLTEGIVSRDLSAEGGALISKWEKTGLLEGIGDDTARNGMARLLENQASSSSWTSSSAVLVRVLRIDLDSRLTIPSMAETLSAPRSLVVST